MQQCKKDNLKAQSQVYQLYAGKLFALSLKYSRNQQDAEDVLQDSFLTAFRKIDQYNFKGSFEGWLKRIVINTALQKYRKEPSLYVIKEEVISEEEVDFDEGTIVVNDLLVMIQALPDRYRLVFNLYVLDSFSHKEIAEMLNISVGTSKSNLSRAKQLLKKAIENRKEKLEKA
ncbi:RNA polymerase sigma factor [Tenacibaculum skagerrakense]|uniref:RNA polymerase sigma factor n=1 Tax=Tenacibaculum skagerrakense TaxID=186571 RepID=UPI002939180C|nr:RNA polymerase sigma factor [Tenacibaculum skagerrakense]